MKSWCLAATSLVLSPLTRAGSQNKWESCSQGNNRLQIGTYQFYSDCNSHTYCASNGTCLPKGCRRDAFPLGYDDPKNFPPLCGRTEFCPDEEDACQSLLEVGSACQLNRDDQCEGPPDWKELADHSGMGLNHNGSVCLNNICMWANVTEGQPCVVENTAYIAYTSNGEFADIVSRDNCQFSDFCDSKALVCISKKDFGEACDADKECTSYNCLANGTCGDLPSAVRKLALWIYILVAACIFTAMVGLLVGLFLLHRKQRDVEREKRIQYWREQRTFHENIKQVRESARHTGHDTSGTTTLHSAYSDESHAPILRQKGSTWSVNETGLAR